MTLSRRVRDMRAHAGSAKQLFWRAVDLSRLAYLSIESIVVRRSIVGDAPCVVSLTSFGVRIADAGYALQTIRRGRVRASRVILWLDDERAVASPNRMLRRLQRAGLEIRHCPDYGPYKKQYPYITSVDEHTLPLVTADDDVLYPRRWLADLMAGFRDRPDVVNCGRARTMIVDENGFAPYATWPYVRSSEPAKHVFPTGVSGTVYPPELLVALRERGDAFRTDAPRADDVWVHSTALRNGFDFRQIAERPLLLRRIPGSDDVTLMGSNVHQGGNDVQIERCYSERDRALIRESAVR